MVRTMLVFAVGLAFGALLTLIVLAQRDEPEMTSFAVTRPGETAPPSGALPELTQSATIDGEPRTHPATMIEVSDDVSHRDDMTVDVTAVGTSESGGRPPVTTSQSLRQQPRIDAPPIPIPDELRRMLDDAPAPDKKSMTMPEAHRAIQAQTKDADWAYRLEQAFRQFFATHPFGANFDIWLIECRSTLCELQGAGYAPDADEQLRAVLEELKQQTWMIQFTGTWGASSGEDGILYFAYIFQRKTAH